MKKKFTKLRAERKSLTNNKKELHYQARIQSGGWDGEGPPGARPLFFGKVTF